jgi:hypothetical protein
MLLALAATCCQSVSADWLTSASTYTHDPVAGRRVAQYAPIAEPTTIASSPIRSSGYTHLRSTLNYGQSADNYHRVETWGDPVRPYDEWRFPYRPYSTPYPNWGAPYAGLGTNIQANLYSPGYGGLPQNPAANGFPAYTPNPLGPSPIGPNPYGPQLFPSQGGGFNPYPPVPSGPVGNPEAAPPYFDGYHPVYQE